MVTLILDTSSLILSCRMFATSRKKRVATNGANRSPPFYSCLPPCDKILRIGVQGHRIVRGRESRVVARSTGFAGVRPLNRSASTFCHRTRCRTLCLTRGKENVETARGTRHDCITVRRACTARCITSVCAYVLRLAPIDIATDDDSGGTVGKNPSDAFHSLVAACPRRLSPTL